MSLNHSEVVQVKVEPLYTDDGPKASECESRYTGHLPVRVKEEPDWNIETYLASQCEGHAVKKVQVTANRDEIKKETEQLSKAAASWCGDHMVKVERDVAMLNVGQIDLQVNALSKTQAIATKLHVPKEPNLITTNPSSIAATSTELYIDHVVKVEREPDELPNKVSGIVTDPNHMQSKTQAMATKLHVKKEPDSMTTDPSNMVATSTGMNVDHMVKVEREPDELANKVLNSSSKESNDIMEHTHHLEEVRVNSGLSTDHMVKIENAFPLASLYMDHVVKEELVVGPEVLQKPIQAVTQGGSTTLNNCFVRLEKVEMNMEHGVCSIGSNIYKLGPHSQRQQDPILLNDQNEQIETKIKPLSHQISKVTEKPFKCDVCDYASLHRYKVNHHKRKHSDDKPFRCKIKKCNYASAFKAHLQIHELTHAEVKPFKCDKCSYACVQKSDLLVHERKHSGEKPYKCGYCAYASARKRDLLTHIRTHTGEKAHTCKYCDYGCIRKRDMIAHTTTYHSELDGQDFKEIFKCSYCRFSTPLKNSLIAHEIKTHCKERQYHYQCKNCNYAVSDRKCYLNHIRKHTGERVEKRHKCGVCDYATSHKSHLTLHQMKHTGVKPHKCNYCSYATGHKRDLFVHEALHTTERPYKCMTCSYGCDSLGNLRTHERIHLGKTEKKVTDTLKDNL